VHSRDTLSRRRTFGELSRVAWRRRQAQRTKEKRSSDAAGALKKYKITISEQARRELRQLPKELRRNIGYRIEVMSERRVRTLLPE
jgi:hypothetical protein